MRTYTCSCGSRVFCDNILCTACGSELGFCPVCQNLSALVPTSDGKFQCGNTQCNAPLEKCFNYSEHHVCNRCLPPQDSPGEHLCDCCRFNATIPDLTKAGNLKKWAELESAKRRLLYDLNQLGLPYAAKVDGVEPALAFAFKEDVLLPKQQWRTSGKTEKVYTSHNAGLITINLQEADPVEREKLRVNMQEVHRTLIGHFRHEIGHFYWDVLVRGKHEEECIALFGDHNSPTYDEALATYYKDGPRADWRETHISAYATMHPWEDFAETWAAYLDMTSTLETSAQVGFQGERLPAQADVDRMIVQLQELALSLNELNRNQGIPDIVPEIYVTPVIEKLRFIHKLVQECQVPVATLVEDAEEIPQS